MADGGESKNITGLLDAHREGDGGALDLVFKTVYQQLRRAARGERRRGVPIESLNTTGLVHEAYLKLVAGSTEVGTSRAHFLSIAACAMRHVLVDYARGRARKKRGGDFIRSELEPDQLAIAIEAEKILAVNEALATLGTIDPRLVRIAECRYFAGLTVPETAEALGISPRTVDRGWQAAQKLLKNELSPSGDEITG